MSVAAKRLPQLDLLRFCLSITIVLYHYQHFIKVPPNTLLRFFYANGIFAVYIFWALAGAVLTHVYLDKKFNFTLFFVHRFARLYPLHFLTLILVGSLQILNKLMNREFEIYTNNSVNTFILNLLFIPSLGIDKGGDSFNAVIWSVSLEIFAYLIFALALTSRLKFVNFVYFCIFVSALGFIFVENQIIKQILLCIFFFGCGCAAYLLANIKKFIIYFAFVCLFVLSRLLRTSLTEFLEYGFLFIALIAFLIHLDKNCNLKILLLPFNLNLRLGNLTYAIFLLHIPIQLVLINLIKSFELNEQLIYSSSLFVTFYVSITCILSSWVFINIELPLKNFTILKLSKGGFRK